MGADGHCPRCGGIASNNTVIVTGPPPLTMTLGTPSLIGEQNLANESRVNVQSSFGMMSSSALGKDGEISLAASGRADVGRVSEATVRDILIDCLTEQGHEAQSIEGADDSRGEDALLRVNGEVRTVQVTTLALPDFWRGSSRGKANLSPSLDEVLGWVREAINRKRDTTPAQDRRTVILTLDVRHFGVLAYAPLSSTLRTSSGAEQTGFDQVWLIGPTSKHSLQLA